MVYGNCSQKYSHSRRGISLIVVLAMMIAATVMATAVYYMLSRYNQRSGMGLYSESAIAATKAGEASAKAWFTYEGLQTVNLVQNFLEECKTATGCKPYRVNMGATYTSSSTNHGQYFDVYLVKVNADSSNLNMPISVQVEIHGRGQGVGVDTSEAVVSAIYNLHGLQFQRPPPVNAIVAANIWGRDAIFVSGSAQNVTKGLDINSGNVYLGSTGEINAVLTVAGNLTSAISGNTVKMNAPVSVDSNAYFGSKLDLNGKALRVNGNTYARYLYMDGGGSSVIIGADTVSGTGGNLWVDSVSGGNIHIRVLKKSGSPKGNLTIAKQLSGSNPYVNSQGDFHIMSGADFSLSNTPNLNAGTDLFVDVNCGMMCPYFEYSKYPGSSGRCFIKLGWLWGTVGSCNSGAAVPTYGGLIPMTYITDADEMSATKALLTAGSGKKPIPYYLSDSTRIIYQKAWTYLRDNFCGSSCQSSSTDFLTAADWNHIYDSVKTTHPDYLQSGYLYVVLDSVGSIKWANMSGVGASDMLLDRNFVFYFRSDPQLKYAYGNTSTSRVVWWSKTGFDELHSVSPIYGILYAQNGDIKITNGEFSLHGQFILANDTKNITTNDSLHVWFDNDVLEDIATSTGLLRVPGSTDNPTPPPQQVTAPWTISLLSPRLQVETASLKWGTSDVSNWGDTKQFGRSAVVLPNLISAQVGDYSNWNDLISAKAVSAFVLPDSEATKCGVTPQPLSSTTSAIDFTKDGSWNVTYLASCGDGVTASANLVVWLRPIPVVVSAALASSVAVSSSSSQSAASSGALSSSLSGGTSSSTLANACVTSRILYDGAGSTFGSWATGAWPSDKQELSGTDGNIKNNYWQLAYQGGSMMDLDNAWNLPSVLNLEGGILKFYFLRTQGSQPLSVYLEDNMGLKSGSQTANSSNLQINEMFVSGFTLPTGFNLNSVEKIHFNYANTPSNNKQAAKMDSIALTCGGSAIAVSSSSSSIPAVSSWAPLSSSSLSSSSNRKPTGGACTADKNAVLTGVSVALSTLSWTDPDGDAVTTYYNFHNGAGWITTNSGSWTSSGVYDISIKGKDAKGLYSDTVNCTNSPVTVTGISSSATAVSSSSAGGSIFITLTVTPMSLPNGTYTITWGGTGGSLVCSVGSTITTSEVIGTLGATSMTLPAWNTTTSLPKTTNGATLVINSTRAVSCRQDW